MNVWIDIGPGSFGISLQMRVSPRWSIAQLKEAVLRRAFLDGRLKVDPPWVLLDHVMGVKGGVRCYSVEEELESLHTHSIRADDRLKMTVRISNPHTGMIRIWPCHSSELHCHSVLPRRHGLSNMTSSGEPGLVLGEIKPDPVFK